MKTILVLFLSLLTSPAKADCRLLLSQGQDSKAYQLYLDHDLRDQTEELEMSVAIIKMVMKNVGCSEQEISELNFKSKQCSYINPAVRYSYSCFLEATEGYYFISQDLLGHINVIFNRWD